MVFIDEKAVDAPGLQRLAIRLNKRCQSQSEYKIYMRLLKARVDYLQKNELLLKFRRA